MYHPRKATPEELSQLAQAQHTYFAYPLDEATSMVETYASIAVFDDYATVAPYYAGKIMLVVWHARPSFYEAYIWDDEGNIHFQASELPT